ncbi:unnamed protein product, partial [Brugia pahangi]|uniref:CPXV119 protein n=1 Tax=Brugia pahangi TaxID=6280 RepID=A0A0N4TDW5_BRUPA
MHRRALVPREQLNNLVHVIGTNNSISAVNIILICAENSAHPMLNDNLVQLINAESPVYMISIDNSLYIISIIVSDSFHALRANNLFRTLRGTSINTVRINNLFRMMRNSIRGIRGGNLIHGIRNVSINTIRIDNLFRIMRNSIHTICANNLIRRISINAIHIDNLFRNNRMRRLSFNALRIGNSSRMISDPIREVRDILPNTTRSNNFFHILCDFFHMIRNPSYTRRISNLPRTSDVNSNVPQLRSALNYSSISSVLAQYGIQTYPINPICIIEPELNDDALHIIREYSMINEIRIGDLLHITRTSDSTYTLYIGDLTYAVHNAEAYQTVYISDFVRVVFSGSILYIIQCTNSLQMMRNLLHAAHAFNSFRTISASNSVHANSAVSLYMIRIGNVAYMITTSDSIHVECFGNLFHVTSTRSSASAIRTCNVGESANIMRDGCSTILVVSIDGRSHTIRTDGSVC